MMKLDVLKTEISNLSCLNFKCICKTTNHVLLSAVDSRL